MPDATVPLGAKRPWFPVRRRPVADGGGTPQVEENTHIIATFGGHVKESAIFFTCHRDVQRIAQNSNRIIPLLPTRRFRHHAKAVGATRTWRFSPANRKPLSRRSSPCRRVTDLAGEALILASAMTRYTTTSGSDSQSHSSLRSRLAGDSNLPLRLARDLSALPASRKFIRHLL